MRSAGWRCFSSTPRWVAQTLERAKDRFLAFRGGSAFLGALCLFLAGWFAGRIVWHYDPDNSWLNLLLSLEASVTTSLLLDLQVKTTARDRATFERILSLEQAIAQRVGTPAAG